MATRRPIIVVEDERDDPPDRLRRCVVEDWVLPTEIPPHLATTTNGRPPDAADVADALLLVARRRHRAAIAEWLATHDAAPCSGRPTFRDRTGFVAAVRARN